MLRRYIQDLRSAHDDADTGDTGRKWNLVQEETGSADQKYRREREHGHGQGQVGRFHCPEDEAKANDIQNPRSDHRPEYAGPITGNPGLPGL